MAKHTPGPWDWRGKSGTLHTLHNRGTAQYGKTVLAPTWEYDSGVDIEVSDEDAALIAASPDMYEALEALHALIDFEEPSTGEPWEFEDVTAINEAMRKAYAALRKARGEA